MIDLFLTNFWLKIRQFEKKNLTVRVISLSTHHQTKFSIPAFVSNTLKCYFKSYIIRNNMVILRPTRNRVLISVIYFTQIVTDT